MSKKKDRAWYVCPQLADLLLRHYASDTAAAQALKTEAKVIAKLRSGTPCRQVLAAKDFAALCERPSPQLIGGRVDD
jgi:hypothetical protein